MAVSLETQPKITPRQRILLTKDVFGRVQRRVPETAVPYGHVRETVKGLTDHANVLNYVAILAERKILEGIKATEHQTTAPVEVFDASFRNLHELPPLEPHPQSFVQRVITHIPRIPFIRR